MRREVLMMTGAYAKIITLLTICELKVKSFLKEEKGAVDIVAIVVIIGVAVLLAIVFKDQLGALITSLFEAISGNSTDVVNNPI